ncbi:MAG: FecR domain-containing protein [Oscillospiraceae bacterium]
MKKFISILAVAMLLLSSTPTAISAQSYATMRLAKAEGTVSVTNQTGTALPTKAGAKLYNGYGISTSSDSYAHLSLDSKKAVKLDQNTNANVKKSGKKLELLVNSGKIFFNITEPLKKDESLELRTSTMVTGIRGTAGTIIKISDTVSQLQLYNGSVNTFGNDPETGRITEYLISPGQVATFTQRHEREVKRTYISIEVLKNHEVPSVAAAAIASDTKLQEKIKEQTKLDIKEIIEHADDDDEDDSEDDDDDKDEALNNTPDKVDPLFKDDDDSDGSDENEGDSENKTDKDDKDDKDDKNESKDKNDDKTTGDKGESGGDKGGSSDKNEGSDSDSSEKENTDSEGSDSEEEEEEEENE